MYTIYSLSEMHVQWIQQSYLSPILFSIFIDNLLHKLHASGFACHVRRTFAGALDYADVLSLFPFVSSMPWNSVLFLPPVKSK